MSVLRAHRSREPMTELRGLYKYRARAVYYWQRQWWECDEMAMTRRWVIWFACSPVPLTNYGTSGACGPGNLLWQLSDNANYCIMLNVPWWKHEVMMRWWLYKYRRDIRPGKFTYYAVPDWNHLLALTCWQWLADVPLDTCREERPMYNHVYKR